MKKIIVLLIIGTALFFVVYKVHKKPGIISPTAISILATPQISPQEEEKPDPRISLLQAFLDSHKCADKDLAAYYIQAATEAGIDWRLMPALSFKEESCTKNLYKNNLWGWRSGETKFDSLSSGIDFIADQLANNHFYKGKTTHQKLKTYNPDAAYPVSVESIMLKISPDGGF